MRAGPLHGVSVFQAIKSMGQLSIGTVQAFALLRRRRPHVILLTGGWVGLPVALAGRALGIPMVIYLPDIEPGLTIQLLAPLATRIAATVPESARYFKGGAGKFRATGYPLRRQMLDAAAGGREAACAQLGLDPARKTVLVFGGSRGARAINTAVTTLLPELLADGVQVVHVTGTLDWETAQAQRATLSVQVGEAAIQRYHAYPYLHDEMGLAMAAADVAVCRSGASVLGELPLFGLPAILVPYPYAWRYQKVNADWLAERGAAVVLINDDLPTRLLPLLRDLLHDEARRAAMGGRARALAQPDGAWQLGQEILQLAGHAGSAA